MDDDILLETGNRDMNDTDLVPVDDDMDSEEEDGERK